MGSCVWCVCDCGGQRRRTTTRTLRTKCSSSTSQATRLRHSVRQRQAHRFRNCGHADDAHGARGGEGLVFKICSSIESWLEADDKNIAAIHCLTGKGRTGTVIACYLAWVGQFPNALEALEFVAEKRNSTVEKLTIPSQRRYVGYCMSVSVEAVTDSVAFYQQIHPVLQPRHGGCQATFFATLAATCHHEHDSCLWPTHDPGASEAQGSRSC